MKKAILISLTLAILIAQAPAAAVAKHKPLNVLLAGGGEPNMIHIWLSPDGHEYVIDSIVPLEVGGDICTNPGGNPNELICQAPLIGGFEVNAGGGADRVAVAKEISIPVTMRGEAGDDVLVGGGGSDKLVGGVGDDKLIGRFGADIIFGGPGADTLLGGAGADVLRGGPLDDVLSGGAGTNDVRQLQRASVAG